jgi:glutamate dehydrogenase/leucine dehydrogenase
VHFAPTIAGIKEFIPGPDMGTNELALGWIKDETGRAGGVPREAGGILISCDEWAPA